MCYSEDAFYIVGLKYRLVYSLVPVGVALDYLCTKKRNVKQNKKK